jgi:hypothetical protein
LEGVTDFPAFRSLFNSFLSAARAITYALQKDAKKLRGFTEWYAEKQAQMTADDLLRFIHDARIEDFHKGRHALDSFTYIHHFSPEEAGPSPAPGALPVIGAEGAFWIVDEGTPRERRIPIKAGSFVTMIRIANPPRMHMGRVLERADPLSICRLALAYLENLVHEAESRFATD